MAMFKKKRIDERYKEAELPDLPEFPELPPLPSSKTEFPALEKGNIPEISSKIAQVPITRPRNLPSFQSFPFGETISQEAIKHTVSEETPEMPFTMPVFEEKPGEEKEEILEEESPEITPKLEAPVTLEMRPSEKIAFKEKTVGIQPVYIRIDKYEQAVKSFEDIKKKVLEIDELLRKLREEKIKEEKDLSEWETEIEIIKAKLEKIDNTVFKKLD